MNARRSVGNPVKRRRLVKRAPSAGAATPTPIDESLNPSLQGVGAGSRYDPRRQDPSVEDPLQDWPEDAAGDRDDWLLERDGRRGSGV